MTPLDLIIWTATLALCTAIALAAVGIGLLVVNAAVREIRRKDGARDPGAGAGDQ